MSMKRWSLICAVGLLLALMVGCKFSLTTANISSLKLSKEKAAYTSTDKFAPADTIYAEAVVSNAPGKMKLRGRLLFDDVSGQAAGALVPGAETTIELPGSATGTFTFTPRGAGWPDGKYKVEVSLLAEDGEQKDQKTESLSIDQ